MPGPFDSIRALTNVHNEYSQKCIASSQVAAFIRVNAEIYSKTSTLLSINHKYLFPCVSSKPLAFKPEGLDEVNRVIIQRNLQELEVDNRRQVVVEEIASTISEGLDALRAGNEKSTKLQEENNSQLKKGSLSKYWGIGVAVMTLLLVGLALWPFLK